MGAERVPVDAAPGGACPRLPRAARFGAARDRGFGARCLHPDAARRTAPGAPRAPPVAGGGPQAGQLQVTVLLHSFPVQSFGLERPSVAEKLIWTPGTHG